MLQLDHETGIVHIETDEYNINGEKVTIRECGKFPVNEYGDYDEMKLFNSGFKIDVDFYDALTEDHKVFFSSHAKPTENEIQIALGAHKNEALFIKVGVVAVLIILFLLFK